jgi:hypothetical protein
MREGKRLSRFELWERSGEIINLMSNALRQHTKFVADIRDELEFLWPKYAELFAERAKAVKNVPLEVYLDSNNHVTRVAVDEVAKTAEECGAFLADAARAIARDYMGAFTFAAVEDNADDVFAFICMGFNERAENIKQQSISEVKAAE